MQNSLSIRTPLALPKKFQPHVTWTVALGIHARARNKRSLDVRSFLQATDAAGQRNHAMTCSRHHELVGSGHRESPCSRHHKSTCSRRHGLTCSRHHAFVNQDIGKRVPSTSEIYFCRITRTLHLKNVLRRKHYAALENDLMRWLGQLPRHVRIHQISGWCAHGPTFLGW